MLAFRHAYLPPTINLEDPDPECDLDYLPGHGREMEVDYILSNSFGFGGSTRRWYSGSRRHNGTRRLRNAASSFVIVRPSIVAHRDQLVSWPRVRRGATCYATSRASTGCGRTLNRSRRCKPPKAQAVLGGA
jgi:hypothetical protein